MSPSNQTSNFIPPEKGIMDKEGVKTIFIHKIVIRNKIDPVRVALRSGSKVHLEVDSHQVYPGLSITFPAMIFTPSQSQFRETALDILAIVSIGPLACGDIFSR